MVAPMGFGLCLLTGVCLEEAVQVLPMSPKAAEVVVADLAVGSITNDRVLPLGQLDEQAGGLTGKELGGALNRVGETESLTTSRCLNTGE
jgi:hypothetical protein